MKKLLLIDAHALIHRMYHAMAPLTAPDGEPIGAIYGLSGLLLSIIQDTVKPDYAAACFDLPGPTFRKEIYEDYKATRQKPEDDLIPQLNRSREVFTQFGIPVFEQAGYEADDLIGTFSQRFKNNGHGAQVVILSGDRDLLQLVEDDVVVAEMMKRGASETDHYDEAAVMEKYGLRPDQIIDYKGLVGDPSDNIPGVSGVGPKTATPLLKEFETVEGVFDNLVIIPEKVAKKFEGKEEIALLSKKLATIDCAVPLPDISLEELTLSPLNKVRLTEYFTQLGFVSLIHRLGS